MDVVELTVDEIEALWTKLNDLHFSGSTYFKEHFAQLRFDRRRDKILANESVSVFGIKENQALVAYCVATVNGGAGEIYSLYVEPDYRGSGVGRQLLDHAVNWLSAQSAETIRVYVAEGNEQALPFYESLGFKPRFHVLQLTTEC